MNFMIKDRDLYDVAVVGLGPVGAVLTGLLSRQGLSVIAIEKDAQVFPLPRAAHIDHTGLRTIQEMGCLDKLLPDMIRNKKLDLLDAQRQLLFRIPADQESLSALPTSVYFYQPEFDAVLRAQAMSESNARVMLGAVVEDFKDDADRKSFELSIRNAEGATSQVRASWLIGCDGARSFVRENAGIKSRSLDFDEQWLVIDLNVDVAATGLPGDHVIEVCDPARPYLSTPISRTAQRFEFMLLEGELREEMTRPEKVAALLKPWLREDQYTIKRAAVYTFHGVVAEQWRKGRLLIAGDAAHQTPPFLGQGMCAGFRDASNLAWKLARVIRGRSDESLIDTYQSERYGHAVKVVEAAIRIGKVICELDPERAAARDRLLRSGDESVKKRLAFSLPRFDAGPLVLNGGGSMFMQFRIAGGLSDDFVGSNFLVISRSQKAMGGSADWWRDEMDAKVMLLDSIDDPKVANWLDQRQADAVVVRPDRYVLGTAGDLDEITTSVKSVLQRRLTGVA